MDYERCEKKISLRIPLTEKQFKEMCRNIFQLDIQQGNYDEKYNNDELFRNTWEIIKENYIRK